MTVTLDDFDKCCRCCLVTVGPFKPLFGASLDEMMFQLVSLKMEKNDSYPQQVCMRCILKLSAAFNFQQTVLNSHQVLTGIIEVSKTDNKDEELELKTSVKENKLLENCQSENIAIHESNIIQEREQESTIEIENQVADVRKETENVSSVPPSLSLPVLPVHTISMLDNVIEKNDTDLKASESLKPYEVMNFKCSLCTKRFNSRVNLKVHMLEHKEACEVCGKCVSSVGRSRHMRTHAAVRAYGCGRCGRRFADRANLARHVRAHAGPDWNTVLGNLCSYCGKRFKWRTSLYKHLRHHNGQMYECRVCGKKFADSSYLRIHVMTHSSTDPKPFMCELCGVSFTQNSSLTKHKAMVHAPQRQRHNCQTCNKSFLHKVSLRTHQIRSHSCDQKQLHQCTECGKQFKLAKSLSAHLGHHKKTAEKLAEDKETEKEGLGKQIVETVREEPTKMRTLSVQYLCLACHKTFRSGEALQKHKCTKVTEETKAEVSPVNLQGPDLDLLNPEMGLSDGLLNCKMCDLSFISSSDLLTHYRIVHDEVMDASNASG